MLRTEAMLDPVSSFLQRCAEWGITVLDLPTAYWHGLTEQMVAEKLPLPGELRLVIIGGETAASGAIGAVAKSRRRSSAAIEYLWANRNHGGGYDVGTNRKLRMDR